MNWHKIWAKISEAAEDDYYSLSDSERAIYNLKNIIDAVNGAGLLSYYESYCADYSEDLVEDLYNAGMDEIAAVIESSNAIFPGGCPPADLDSRIEIIDSWEHEYDSLFEQWNDDILEFALPLEQVIEKLVSDNTELIGYNGKTAVRINLCEVYCFVTERNKVYAVTEKEKLLMKLRLYQLEEIADENFVKINQSCIANIRMKGRFDASVSGTMRVVFKNGYTDYVSRRQMKTVKERLGL